MVVNGAMLVAQVGNEKSVGGADEEDARTIFQQTAYLQAVGEVLDLAECPSVACRHSLGESAFVGTQPHCAARVGKNVPDGVAVKG